MGLTQEERFLKDKGLIIKAANMVDGKYLESHYVLPFEEICAGGYLDKDKLYKAFITLLDKERPGITIHRLDNIV